MFCLSLGVASIDTTLPGAAYALLSGLNASVVGVIALATTELSGKAITDSLTRLIVFTVASAGMFYNALWYFPVLMAGSGFVALVYDMGWLQRVLRPLTFWRRRATDVTPTPETGHETPGLETGITNADSAAPGRQIQSPDAISASPDHGSAEDEPRIIPEALRIDVSWKAGAAIISSFAISFLAIVIIRAVLPDPPRLYALFANMYLAGTIIFGGGPVVIPLLREYIVAEGWVSQRDFLIGLAIIQAFPGPNFNFAVFLGSLTAANAGHSAPLGALLAWVGVFTPGMVLVHGIMGLWSVLRNRRPVRAILRGINAGAVGLIYTAVYRIWQVGFLDDTAQQGRKFQDPRSQISSSHAGIDSDHRTKLGRRPLVACRRCCKLCLWTLVQGQPTDNHHCGRSDGIASLCCCYRLEHRGWPCGHQFRSG